MPRFLRDCNVVHVYMIQDVCCRWTSNNTLSVHAFYILRQYPMIKPSDPKPERKIITDVFQYFS